MNKENNKQEKKMNVDTDFGCDACEELARSMSNPCQCLSCDPDGTRYICTCDENNEQEKIMEYTKEVVNQYFETDLDNCLLTQTDFCNIIADILDNPKPLKDEIKEYFKIRESEER